MCAATQRVLLAVLLAAALAAPALAVRTTTALLREAPRPDDCLDDDDCRHSEVCVRSECLKLKDDGDACRSDEECRSGTCQKSWWPATTACATPCGHDDDCPSSRPICTSSPYATTQPPNSGAGMKTLVKPTTAVTADTKQQDAAESMSLKHEDDDDDDDNEEKDDEEEEKDDEEEEEEEEEEKEDDDDNEKDHEEEDEEKEEEEEDNDKEDDKDDDNGEEEEEEDDDDDHEEKQEEGDDNRQDNRDVDDAADAKDSEVNDRDHDHDHDHDHDSDDDDGEGRRHHGKGIMDGMAERVKEVMDSAAGSMEEMMESIMGSRRSDDARDDRDEPRKRGCKKAAKQDRRRLPEEFDVEHPAAATDAEKDKTDGKDDGGSGEQPQSRGRCVQCMKDKDCAEGFYCERGFKKSAHTCLELGKPCEAYGDCSMGEYCDSTARRCRPYMLGGVLKSMFTVARA